LNTARYIAKRYLFSKKSVNAIHIISGISMLGVLVGSAALIIILSVFNGFEGLILSMYNNLGPDLEITPANAKHFNPNNAGIQELAKDKRVLNYTEVLQEKALMRYGNTQFIGKVKGVSANYAKGKAVDSVLLDGDFDLEKNGEPTAIIGASVQSYLSVNIGDQFQTLDIYAPRKGISNSLNPADEFAVRSVFPVGVLRIQQEVNDMVLVPISLARDLLGEPGTCSSLEISVKPSINTDDFQEELTKKLGNNFVVKNRIQQNELLYKILNSEKWAIFLILTFVLIIAIFNIIGSLTMLVIDKRKDIAILSSMGASKSLIRRIFFLEGMMISGIGCLIGLAVALAFCLIQQKTGFVKMDDGPNPLLESYPIALKISDFGLVTLTVLGISAIASAISSRLSVKTLDQLKETL
jgi:lipoprotein-releasing system permease protein